MNEGINALDLIPSPIVTDATFSKAVAVLESNFGVAYSPEKLRDLFELLQEEGWSDARFNRTLIWFVKNKSYPAWTIADWFNYSVRIYPIEWYHQEQKKAGIYVQVLDQMDTYKLPDGAYGYRYKDGEELPFKKVSRN